MPDYRSFHRPREERPSTIQLSANESHHLLRVNRARKNDPVIVFDGLGNEWLCRLEGETKGVAYLVVQSHQEGIFRPFSIALAQSLPKGKTMDSIVRKSTEIGVQSIFPLLSDHSEVKIKPSSERGVSKEEKWRAVALEASKQSGNSFLPLVAPIQDFASFLSSADDFDLRVIASLHPETIPLRKVLLNNFEGIAPPKTAVCLIGPEGDFTRNEVESAKSRGFFPISLGPYVLRCETAAIACLTLVTYELENFCAISSRDHP